MRILWRSGTSFEENAVIKARAVMELTGSIALADDTRT